MFAVFMVSKLLKLNQVEQSGPVRWGTFVRAAQDDLD